ncbi:MAG: hypothetical protein J6I61_05165 [Prevotella sp.]|nr:hypothetical protein [Prevotella sp.]MBQ8453306.1 hypothetical protein [Prevotella sp.]MBR1651834.1 hypothetical protein [Alloprevotella sp.]
MAEKIRTSVTFETQSDHSYSCIVDHQFDNYGLIGYGKTAREAEEDVFTEIEEMRTVDGMTNVPDVEITERKFDVGAFFSYYPFFNITSFARFTGLNPTQVRQYASGVRQPTAQKKKQLNEAIQTVIQTLSQDSRAFSID